MKIDGKSEFNFTKFADSLYYQRILKSTKPINIRELVVLNESNQDSAFRFFGNRLGIGNAAFFMVSFEGQIQQKSENGLLIRLEDGKEIWVDTKFIFGNAIRDASKMVQLTDFKTNADFNKLSEALNTIIREKAIPPILKTLSVNEKVEVIGVLKLSKNLEVTMPLSVLPVTLEKKL